MTIKDTLKLTDRDIRQWIKSNTRFDAKPDGNGLYIRYRAVDKNPLFYFRFKFAGVENKISLGKFPEKSLASARKDCVSHRAVILKGINPALLKREQKADSIAKALAEQNTNSVNELVDDFCKRNIDGCKSAIEIRQRIDNHIIPAIGKMKVDAVMPIHISNMLDGITKPSAANKVLSLSKRIFNHAIKRHAITHNPASAFDITDAGGSMPDRTRFLSEAELIRLFKVMREAEKFTRHHYLTTKLLLLVGCRKGELFKAKRDDFDLLNATWTMSENNKTKSAITIPLSIPALAIITELMQFKLDGSEYLFPTFGVRVSKTGYIDDTYLCRPLQKMVYPLMGDIEPFVIHDLRRTMRTHLGKLGVDRFVAERCLNHKIAGMEGVYDAGDYFTERKAALDKWAMFLESCERGESWNVTPIRKTV
ncbi:MAG: tyrosine-type recombinase/integrase [Methylococcaceae bacterium]